MIQAIIFDCFGVLAADGWLPFKRKYFSANQDLFQRAGDLNKQVDSGLADYQEFIEQVASLAGITPKEARYQIEQNPAHTEVFDYIKNDLKPKYKIGLLSNSGANWLPELFTSEQIKLFDAIALSYETGITKPDPRAYQIIAQRLAVDPVDCIFIDDQDRFCTSAQDAGMQAIVYQTLPHLQADLKKILAKQR